MCVVKSRKSKSDGLEGGVYTPRMTLRSMPTQVRESMAPEKGREMRFWRIGSIFLLLAALGMREEEAKWELVWSDEFDGKSLDQSKWELIVNGRGGGNNELQYYRRENARIENGMLVIEARKEKFNDPDGSRDYTSAKIRTKGKSDWTYGRIEVRAKLPKGKGIWPAIWMMPTDNRYGNWPNSGEIDIVELVGQEPQIVHGTLHYGDRQRRQMD